MTAQGLRRAWEALRERLDREARDGKYAEEAWSELSKAYGRLSAEERRVVDTILEEWVVSDDETKRSDALSLIADHQVLSTLPALQALAARLVDSHAPSAPFELAWVQRIIARLIQTSGAPT